MSTHGSREFAQSIASLGPEPGVPIMEHMSRTFRAVLRGPRVTRDHAVITLITGEAHPFGNFALFRGSATAPLVASSLAPLVRCGAPAAAIFTGSVPREALAHLAEAGFASARGMPAMAVEIDAMKEPSLPSGCTFSRASSGHEGAEWVSAFALGYGLPPVVANVFSPNAVEGMDAPDAPLQFFVVREHGAIVGTSALHLDDGVAGVYCVSTLPAARGRGIGAGATALALRHARRLGYRVGILQSSELGHSVYLGLGFRDYGEGPLFVRMPE